MATAAERRRKGRQERLRKHIARIRRPNLYALYSRVISDLRPGGFTFRLTLYRGAEAPVPLDRVVESFFWEDTQASLVGGLELRRPLPEHAGSLAVGSSMIVRCDVHWQSRWYRLWTMAIKTPESPLYEGTTSIELEDDLTRLDRDERDWIFRKTKTRKRGYRCDEIAREVCRREGVRVGYLARGTKLQVLKKKRTRGLAVIKEAYEEERKATGRKYVVRMRDGELDVLPLGRNSILFEFREQVEDASVSQSQKQRPVTVLVGTGRTKKGTKLRHTEQSLKVIARYGKVTKEKNYGRVEGLADLRSRVQRDYADEIRVKHTGEITVPLVPFLRRGDGLRWVTKEAGWHGATKESRDRSFVFATGVRHEVTSGSQTSRITLSQEDAYAKDAERVDKLDRDAAEKRRKKRTRG
jgi:hypothetical protein